MTIPVRKFHNSLLARLGVGILPFVVIVFVVSLGFLFKWSRDMVRQEAIERANLMLTNTSLRVGSYIQEIQTITNNTIWLVEENLVPDSLLGYTRRVVELNTDACGCSITMEPDFFPQYGHCFSAYTFFDGDSLATFIEKPYDYYNKVWYKRAYETGEPVWSDP